jgi:hypothetical protein
VSVEGKELATTFDLMEETSMADTNTVIEQAIDRYLQWELGGGRFQGAGQEVDTLDSWRENSGLSFNLKHRDQKRYLGWKKMGIGRGVNLGYSGDAGTETAREKARWFFRRSSGSGPVRYGEPIAMGYGTSPSLYKYEETIGPVVNIANTETPSYEWRFIGGPGTKGQPVRTGEWLAIFNDVEADFLIYFKREVGVDLGWPDSKTVIGRLTDIVTEAASEALEAYIKSYASGGQSGGAQSGGAQSGGG